MLTVLPELGDAQFRAVWSDLAVVDPHSTVFQGPRFLGVWQRVLGRNEDVTTVAVHDEDQLLGVVVEAIGTVESSDDRVLRFGGGNEVTDYLGPVARPEAASAFAEVWARRLVKAEDFDRAELGGLADDTGWPKLLVDAVVAADGTVTDHVRDDVAPVVDIAAGHDAWLTSLPGKQRQELKRKARKLTRDLGGVTIDEIDVGGIDAGLEAFLAMTDNDTGPKAGFFQRDAMRALFRALADEFLGDRTFRLHVLRVGDRPAAATVSLVHGDRWGLYNSAFDPLLGGFAPGMVLVSELIEQAADEGLTSFDLLRGDEDYKYRFGAVDRVLSRIDVAQ